MWGKVERLVIWLGLKRWAGCVKDKARASSLLRPTFRQSGGPLAKGAYTIKSPPQALWPSHALVLLFPRGVVSLDMSKVRILLFYCSILQWVMCFSFFKAQWLPNANEINTKNMPNTRTLRLGPNATYIPLTCVGVSRWGNANFSVFRYQHVGIGNANCGVWGLTQWQWFCVAVEHRLKSMIVNYFRQLLVIF